MAKASQSESSRRREMRSLTLTALLGVFILAVFVALIGHLLPGWLSRLGRRALRRGEDDRP
jgi:hypothetical protein